MSILQLIWTEILLCCRSHCWANCLKFIQDKLYEMVSYCFQNFCISWMLASQAEFLNLYDFSIFVPHLKLSP